MTPLSQMTFCSLTHAPRTPLEGLLRTLHALLDGVLEAGGGAGDDFGNFGYAHDESFCGPFGRYKWSHSLRPPMPTSTVVCRSLSRSRYRGVGIAESLRGVVARSRDRDCRGGGTGVHLFLAPHLAAARRGLLECFQLERVAP